MLVLPWRVVIQIFEAKNMMLIVVWKVLIFSGLLEKYKVFVWRHCSFSADTITDLVKQMITLHNAHPHKVTILKENLCQFSVVYRLHCITLLTFISLRNHP